MTESLAARLRRQAQELLDLAEVLEPSRNRHARAERTAKAPDLPGQQLLVQKAVAMFGSQGEFAQQIGVKQPHVSRMCNGTLACSPRLAREIHRVTNGEVSQWKLRPDIFDAPAAVPA